MPKLLFWCNRFLQSSFTGHRIQKSFQKTLPAVQAEAASCLYDLNTGNILRQSKKKGQSNSFYSHSIISSAPIQRGSLKRNS